MVSEPLGKNYIYPLYYFSSFPYLGAAYIAYNTMYSSPSILQPSILRSPLIIRPLDLVQKGNFLLNDFYLKATCNIRPHFFGPMGGLVIDGPLYM